MTTPAPAANRLTELLDGVVAGFDITSPHVVGAEQVAGDPSGTAQRLTDPTTGAPLYDYLPASAALVDAAVASAARAQRTWARLAPAERGLRLTRLADLLLEHAPVLAEAESRTVGKPIRETRAEMALTANSIRYFAGWADKNSGLVPPTGDDIVNVVTRVPLGVLGLLTPWNAPVVTAGTNLGPMLATGNAVVVKPSELTPLTTAVIALLAARAGLPAGLVNVVAGPGDPSGRALVAHEGVAKVTFIGSLGTGRRVAADAAARGAGAVLELGGKSAQIVFSDADLDRAVPAIVSGIFGSAGQSCTAGSRLLVDERIADTVLDRVRQATAALVPGDPVEAETTLGPLVSAAHYDRVRGFLDRARDAGGQVLAGGGRPERAGCRTGYFLEPTIVASDPAHELAREEVFGPVLSVMRFAGEPEAIEMANATPYDLGGSVWTADIDRAFRVARAVRSGVFWINTYKVLHPGSPFGGAHGSGYGRSSGVAALTEYTRTRSLLVKVDPGEGA
ncbi:aldehyde dehydrogenase family protein [Actinomadura sp. 6K520]|uniref:aldehyde dehydrogenase family protein n=1 Tax=Actinomadura sp. 6K520 TaxID=2530364 RepID=UPI0014049C36|nr:aldehyde dehydrogenase family protein [Actinomadura sp. 6K520]